MLCDYRDSGTSVHKYDLEFSKYGIRIGIIERDNTVQSYLLIGWPTQLDCFDLIACQRMLRKLSFVFTAIVLCV